ncbi:MAG: hypothetical protein J3K34DRAFT_241023 [Monoraphidium minutum]|nr:MAG: hypothetical protein J3K34DRAFT_241023 [Monoraphidium minutum]
MAGRRPRRWPRRGAPGVLPSTAWRASKPPPPRRQARALPLSELPLTPSPPPPGADRAGPGANCATPGVTVCIANARVGRHSTAGAAAAARPPPPRLLTAKHCPAGAAAGPAPWPTRAPRAGTPHLNPWRGAAAAASRSSLNILRRLTVDAPPRRRAPWSPARPSIHSRPPRPNAPGLLPRRPAAPEARAPGASPF